MNLAKTPRKELIFFISFILISIFIKPHIDNLIIAVIANVSLCFLCLWYLRDTSIFTSKYLIIQIIHSLWSTILIIFTILYAYFSIFNIHSLFLFNKYIFFNYMNYFFVQLLVAVTEELIFRKSFCKILSKLKLNKVIIVILISLIFGLWHLFLHHSYTQFVSSFLFSLLLLIFQIKINNFTLISCICTHFLYNFLCSFLIFS